MKNILVFAAAFVAASGFVAAEPASAFFHPPPSPPVVHDYGTEPGDYDYALNGSYPDIPDHAALHDHVLIHPIDNPGDFLGQAGFLYTYNGCNKGGATSAPRSISTLATRDSCKNDFQGQYIHSPFLTINIHVPDHASAYSNGTAN